MYCIKNAILRPLCRPQYADGGGFVQHSKHFPLPRSEVEHTAAALIEAAVRHRGHRRVWRRDLVDAITAALVKDDLQLIAPWR